MRSRFSAVDRFVARVLVWVLIIGSVWTSAPPVSARRLHGDATTIGRRPFAAYEGQSAQTPPQTITIYGPHTFTRTRGRPNVLSVTITVPSGVVGPFTLHVQNGEADHDARLRHDDGDDDDEDDENNDRRDHHPAPHHFRVTNAEIAINGQVVASKADFRRHVPDSDKTINLTPRSTMTVTMKGKPNCYLVLSIFGRTGDRTPPQISIVAPRGDAVIASSTPELVVSYSDPAGPTGASGVDTSTLAVLVDGVDRTSLFAKGTGQATAQPTAAHALGDGAHALTATVADRAGNRASTSASFTVDTTAPTIQLTDPPAGRLVNTATPTIRVSYRDVDGVDLSTLRVLVGGVDRTNLFALSATGAVATLDGPAVLADGMVQVTATIRDAVGNTGGNSWSFIVDTAAPSVEVVEPGIDHYTSADAIAVAGTVADASPVAVSVNGIAAAIDGSSFRASGVPLGAGPDVTLQIVAADAAGNVARAGRIVHVDRVSPTVQILQPARGAYVSGSIVAVSGSVSDASPVTLTVNGVPAAVGAGSFSASLAAQNGPIAIHVVAEDAAGNTASADTTATLDSVAPVVSIAMPGEGFVTNQRLTRVTGSVSDAAPVTVTVNGAPAATTNDAFSVDVALADGGNTIAVNAVDAAGNSSSAEVHVSLDQALPTVQIATPADGAYLATATPSIRVVYQDNGSVDLSALRILVDGQDLTSRFIVSAGEAAATLEALGDGPHSVSARTTDRAGNTATASATFRVDTTKPDVAILEPAAGTTTNAAMVTVVGSVTDASPVAVTVNGVAATVNGGRFTAVDVPFGGGAGVTLTAIAIDAVGNEQRASVDVAIDRAAPVVHIVQPAARYVKGPSFTVSGTASDTSLRSVTVNGVAAAIDGASFTATISAADGSLTVSVRALDAANNEGAATFDVIVDSVAPSLSITAPAAGLVTNRESVRVEGTVSDGSPLSLRIGGADVSSASGAFSYDAPIGAEGVAQVAVVATDAAGNQTSQAVSVIVDRTAPVIAITAPAAGAVLTGPSIVVSGSVSDTASAGVVVNGVAASVSGTTFMAAVPASDGSFAVQVTATDAAGNSASATTIVTIDGAAPVVTILEPANGQYTAATTLDVTGGVNDASAVRISVNGIEATITGHAFVAPGVAVGVGPTVPIEVVATDAAGNVSTSTVTVRVDRMPPAVRITTPVADAYRRGPVLRIEGTVSDLSPVLVEVNGEIAMIADGVFSADVPAPGDGPFTAVATARDAAGNASTASVSVVVDSVAPQISVSSPAQGLVTNQGTIQLVGSVSDTSPLTLRLGDVLVPLSNNTFTQAAALAPEGERTLTLRATDAAGNESTFDVHVTLDQTPPDLSVTAPDANAMLGSVPVVAQGFVYDATATTVSVNGAPATRVEDAWHSAVAGLSEGPQRLTIVATDAAGNTQTVTRDVMLDLAAPVVTFASPASGALTNAQTIDVGGVASDPTLASVVINGTAATLGPATGTSRPFAATIALTEGENHLVATATDAFARTAQTEVIVARDSTAPTVSIAAGATISRLRGASATISAQDEVGLAQITVTLNGLPVGSFTAAPATLALTAPAAASVGDVLTVTVTATDRAGNSASASQTLRVIADGVVTGQVLSDETGRPLPGATVTMVGGSGGSATARDGGGYSLPGADATALLSITSDGMTTVERQVPIQNGVGTAVVDARLTTIDPATTIGPEGGTLTAPSIAVSIPAGSLSAPAALSLTRLSAQGLPALLPLGWSPLTAFLVSGDGGAALPAMTADASGLPALAAPSGNPILVTYRSSTHAWFVVSPQIDITESRASFTIPGVGAYAVVVADVMNPPIAVPPVDQPLTGVDLVELPPTATAAGTVSPSTLPPGGGTAAGSLAIQSSTPLPSGTIVQAQVTESYGLTTGAVASEEQRTHDIVLYRQPAAGASQPAAGAQPSAPALSAFFPMTPSRAYDQATLVEGTVHLDILAGRESVRGQAGGSGPIAIDAGGGVTLTVPAHALPADTAVRVQSAILSAFVPGATPNTAPPDVQPLGEALVDFASQTLGLTAELTVGLAPGVALDPADSLLVARVVRIGGVPRMFVVARAEAVGDRLVSRAVPGLPGITESGRYVFYRIGGITGFVAGMLSASGSTVSGVVESDTLPFVGLAGGDGRFVIATRAANVTLTGRVAGASLQGAATVTVAAGQTAARDIVLAGAVTTATVTPGDGASLVDITAQIELQTSAPLDPNAVDLASLTLTTTSTPPETITTRRVLSGSGQVLAVVPATKLAAATTYRFEAAGLLDVHGGAVAIPPVTFTTKADAPSTYDTRKVVVSTPDDDGIAHVRAEAGTVPPGTQVLVVNAGSGSVASFTADNDGALDGEVSATVEDRLIVTITDPAGAVATFERGAYVAPDQSKTAVNAAGGIVDEPGQAGFAAGAKLVIPPDALAASLFFSLTRVELRAVFPDEPDPDVPAGHIGDTIKITAPEGPLQKEAKISFDKPADAPDGAAYLVFRRLKGPDGRIAYEILDQALLDPQTGKVTTASPPYAGFGLSLGGYTASGIGGAAGSFAIGAMVDQYETLMWMFDQALPKPLPGLITGTVRRAKFVPGATAPIYEPVPNAMVSGVAISGRPLYAEQTGATVAISQRDGTFALFDPRYSGGQVTISAQSPDGEVVTSTAYEANAQEGRAGYLLRYYHNVAVANVTFAAKAPPVGPTRVTVHAFTGSDASPVEVSGPITAGTAVRIRVTADIASDDPKAPKPSVTNLTIQQTPYTVTPDDQAGDWFVPESFVPPQAGTYVITATAQPPVGSPVTGTFILRAVAPGGSTRDSLPNDPPAVITSLTYPKAGAPGLQPTVVPQVSFTEPVKNIADGSAAHVTLTDGAGTAVPLDIQGAGLTGPVEHITDPNVIVTGLTLQPIAPLKYGTTYTLTLTADIVDTDATPKHLAQYQTTFTTFQPARLLPTDATSASAADQFNGGGLAVVGNRAYLAQNNAQNTTIRLFDVTKPEQPEEIVVQGQGSQLASPPPVVMRGHPADLAVEDESPAVGQGRLLAVGLTNLSLPYHPSNLMFYDVTSDDRWRWVGAVTLGTDPIDGMVRRIQLRGNRVYAATPGVGKGIQVVDVPQALSLFAAASAAGGGTPDSFELGRSLGLEGQGFGRQAIAQTIFVPSPNMGNMSNVWDLDIIDLTVDGTSQPIVVAAGRAGLTIANPQAQSDQLLFNGPVVDGGGAPVMDWGFNVAAGMVNGVPVAAVLAFTSPSQGGFGAGYLIVVVDLSDPRAPKLLGTLPMPSFPAGVRSDLLLRDDRLLVGTDSQTYVVGLTNPARPQLLGAINGVGGRLAFNNTGVLFSNVVGFTDTVSSQGGVRSATLGTTALITRITPSELTNNPSGAATTARDVVAQFQVVPADYQMSAANVEIFRNGQLVDTLTATANGPSGQAIWPAGRTIDRNAVYTARVTVDPDSDRPLVSAQAPVPLVQIVFVDRRGEENFAPPLSDPRPHIVLDAVTPGAVTVAADGTQMDVRLSGTVTDSLADIVPDHLADIRQITVAGQSLAVQPAPEPASITRPYAFRGRFSGTVHVPIDDGANRLVVEAANTVGNSASAAATVTIQQTLATQDPPAAPAISAEKYLDPFTLVLQPLRADAPDSLVLYHHTGGAAAADIAIAETGDDTRAFAGSTPELGDVAVTLTSVPSGSGPQTFNATISTSAFAIIDEPLRFVETAGGSRIFKTIARRLPDNSLMRVAFNGTPGAASATTATVTIDTAGKAVSATLPASGDLAFSTASSALGRSSLRVQSVDGASGQPRRLDVFFSSETPSLADHYVTLGETGAGTGQFETETQVLLVASDPIPPTPLSTSVVSVVNDAESPESPAEPVWVVARGLRTARVGDVGVLDNTAFELTTAAAPASAATAAPPAVRFALPVAFVRETGSSAAPNVKRAMAARQAFDRTSAEATPHEAAIRFIDAPVIRRSFSSLALSKAVVARNAQTRLVLTWVSDRPDLQVASIAASTADVTLSIKTNVNSPVQLNASRVVLIATATVARDAANGPRDLRVTFTNGDVKTFRNALTVSPGRAIVFAIDGLSRAAFDSQVSKPGTAMNRVFGAPASRHQAVDATVVASFPPITFSRWATIFSGKPPKDTLAAGLQWFNRQALIGGTDQYGLADQWLGTPDTVVAGDVLFRPGAYNRYFKPDFVYDKLRASGFRSIVLLQQAGLGRGNSQGAGDDRWVVVPRNAKITWNAAFAGSEAGIMDELATGLAERELRNLGTDFDLMVVYLPGLDHQLHVEGLFNRSGQNTADEFFRSSLDGRLNRIINAAAAFGDTTIFGVMADHGHFDTNTPQTLELDDNGDSLFAIPTMRTVLQATRTLRVSNAYRSWGNFFSFKQPNVIYDPQFGMANIYVARNARQGGEPNWRRSPSLDDLEPIVNNLFYSYMNKPWERRPVADILVRVPGGNDGFNGDHYMALSRGYDRNKSNCGADHLQHCTLLDQLVDPGTLVGVGNGYDTVDQTPAEWRYYAPAERLADWISPNSGDIVLLGNGIWGYQFGSPYRAQHGSLTRADARVPIAFGFPGAAGDAADDTMLDSIKNLLSTLGGGELPACAGPTDNRRCVEEQLLERFFLRPPQQ